MTSHLSEEALWAQEMAARLRLLQASCADAHPAERQKYISEEIERGLKGVVASRKNVYLEALAEKFPAWQAQDPSRVVVEESAKVADDSPEVRLKRLLDVLPRVSEGQRAQFAQQLKQAGVAVQEQKEVTLEVADEIAAKLYLAPGQELNYGRALKMLAALNELVLLLEQPAWRMWKELAPNSKIRRDGGGHGDLKRLIGRYLSGDPEVSTQQVLHVLEQSRRLIAGLLTAIGPSARQYAYQYFHRFSPEAIKDLAQMEKGFAGLEQKCWRKYVDLASNYPTEVSIEKEIRDMIAKCAEEFMFGRTASSGA